MCPVIWILGRPIGSYGLCMVLGFACIGVTGIVRGRRLGIRWKDVVICGAFALGLGLACGNLLYLAVTYKPEELLARLVRWDLRMFQEGFVFYGGMAGGAAGCCTWRGSGPLSGIVDSGSGTPCGTFWSWNWTGGMSAGGLLPRNALLRPLGSSGQSDGSSPFSGSNAGGSGQLRNWPVFDCSGQAGQTYGRFAFCLSGSIQCGEVSSGISPGRRNPGCGDGIVHIPVDQCGRFCTVHTPPAAPE